MKRWYWILLFAALLALTVGVAGAQGQVIAADEVVRDNVNVRDSSLRIDGEILGDLNVYGGAVTLNGKIDGDVAVWGGSLHVNGEIDGDLVVFGGSLSGTADANLDGDCVVLGGTFAATDSDLRCTRVNPDLESVLGTLGAIDPPAATTSSPFLLGIGRFFGEIGRAFGLSLTFGTLALAVAGLFPRHLDQVQQAIRARPVASGAVGLLTAVAGPAALGLGSILLLLTCVGILAIPLLVVLALGLALVGWVAVGEFAGDWLVRRLGLRQPTLPVTAAAGTALMTLALGLLNAVSLEFLSVSLFVLLLSVGLGAAALTKLGTRPYPGLLQEGKVVAPQIEKGG